MGFKANGIERKILRRSKELSIIERKNRFKGVDDGCNSIRKSRKGF